MSVLQEPIGQGEGLHGLVHAARSLHLHHAVLLCGPPGVGKSTAARWLAAAVLCPADDPRAPCGQCLTCDKVASGMHPDLHWLAPPEDKRVVPVDAVRALQQTLERLPVEGRARVVVIDPADALNEQGQNALLKTLEEPGKDTFLLLPTARPEALLETVRSRVLRQPLRPVAEAVVRTWLEKKSGLPPARLERAVTMAGGRAATALRLCGDDADRIHDLVVPWWTGTHTLGAVALARACLDGADGRPAAVERAQLVLVMLRAMHRPGFEGCLEGTDSGTYAPSTLDPWTARSERLFAAEEDLALQIPPDQVLTGLFLALEEVSA